MAVRDVPGLTRDGAGRGRPRAAPAACAAGADLHLEYVPAKVGRGGMPFPSAWRYRLLKAAVVGP